MEAQEREFAERARERRLSLQWHRRPGIAYDQRGNAVQSPLRGWGDSHPEDGTKSTFRAHMGGAYEAWRSHVPSAEALRFLSGPYGADSIRHRRTGEDVPIDENMRHWMIACSDAVGIRSRAAIMAHIVSSHCAAAGHFEWLSVACGTALPVFQTAEQLGDGFSATMTLLDFDVASLQSAVALHGWFGVRGRIATVAGNVFDPAVLGGHRADFVDAMGIFEYIGDPLIELQRQLGIDTGPSQFLRACYDAARERLVFGQMLTDRPNPDWTMGVIGWPYVEMRTIPEVVQIVREAGIPTSELTIYVPDLDPVYAVYAIQRPRA